MTANTIGFVTDFDRSLNDILTVVQMEEMAMDLSQGRMRVYVIMRVSNLTAVDVDLDIFVDPLKFKGTLLDFAAEQWFVSIR